MPVRYMVDDEGSVCPRLDGELVSYDDYKALEGKLEESELLRVSAENRWQNAMRRLHERFGDCLAVHKADIEALLGRLQGEAAALHTAASVGPAGTKEDANAGSARDSNTEDDWHNPGDLLEINQLQSRLSSIRSALQQFSPEALPHAIVNILDGAVETSVPEIAATALEVCGDCALRKGHDGPHMTIVEWAKKNVFKSPET